MKEKRYFWDGLLREGADGPVLIGHKCKKCGKISFPATTLCTDCLGDEFEDVDLPRYGKLYSHTATAVPVGKFPLPHAMGHVIFPEAKVRIFGPMSAEDDLRSGDDMVVTEDVLWTEEDGTPIWGYRFRKVAAK